MLCLEGSPLVNTDHAAWYHTSQHMHGWSGTQRTTVFYWLVCWSMQIWGWRRPLSWRVFVTHCTQESPQSIFLMCILGCISMRITLRLYVGWHAFAGWHAYARWHAFLSCVATGPFKGQSTAIFLCVAFTCVHVHCVLIQLGWMWTQRTCAQARHMEYPGYLCVLAVPCIDPVQDKSRSVHIGMYYNRKYNGEVRDARSTHPTDRGASDPEPTPRPFLPSCYF